jgi:ABC-type nitrate/sulfonate/bicarbonate transport system ATPase subunit
MPSLLLLDEPFGALDPIWRLSLYRYVDMSMATSRATLVLITHDIDEAILLCSKAIILSASGHLTGSVQLPSRTDTDQHYSPEATAARIATTRTQYMTILSMLQEAHPAG